MTDWTCKLSQHGNRSRKLSECLRWMWNGKSIPDPSSGGAYSASVQPNTRVIKFTSQHRHPSYSPTLRHLVLAPIPPSIPAHPTLCNLIAAVTSLPIRDVHTFPSFPHTPTGPTASYPICELLAWPTRPPYQNVWTWPLRVRFWLGLHSPRVPPSCCVV